MAKKTEEVTKNDTGLENPQTSRNEEANNVHSFHPSQITLQTFRDLLSCYATTVSQKHRRKATLKLQSKARGAPKGKTGKKSDAISTTKTELDASEEQQIREETDKFLELDRWRYEVLPKIVEERKVKGDQGEGSKVDGAHLLREELVDIMDWKMKHGVFRPALMGMVKNNQDKTVTKSTSTAFAALPDADPILAPSEAFPKASLDALTAPLRGVGPATASLILSIGTILDSKRQVPFYSDDVYLWLVLGDFPNTEDQVDKKSSHKKPNGELIAKYDINEYRDLWKCTHELRERLNKEIAEHDRPVALIDIEKVAYVIRNIADSGYRDSQSSRTVPQGLDIEESEQENESDKAKKRRPKEEKADKVERRESKRLKQ